jgi:hypothetical protein
MKFMICAMTVETKSVILQSAGQTGNLKRRQSKMKTHIELLGWVNLLSGAFWELLGLGILAAFILLAPTTGDPTGSFALITMGVVVGGYLLVLGIPTLIAGIGLLKLKSWARVLALIVGIFGFFSFPFGTLIALYTFWVLTKTEAVALLGADA